MKKNCKIYSLWIVLLFILVVMFSFLSHCEEANAENIEQITNMNEKLQIVMVENNALKNNLNTLTIQNEELKKDCTMSENFKYLGKFELTYYSDTGITKSGNPTIDGVTVAVDPKVIPLDTDLYIDGEGVRIAHDTGGAVKGNIIDVYLPNEDKCIKNGRKYDVDVWVIE